MKRVLLIEDEPLICDRITESFENMFGAEIECARNGLLGARMIAAWHFDLAVIDFDLPEISCFELAGFAANQNIPVPLIAGHPERKAMLTRFGYPFLAKPLGLDTLCAEAVRIIEESRANIIRVQLSAARMLASAEALSAAVMESRRLLREIRAQQAARKMDDGRMQSRPDDSTYG